MGYFPFFMDIGGKKGVIVGGGKVAARKVEKLAAFGPCLTVVAPRIEACMRAQEKLFRHDAAASLCFCQREFKTEDLDGADFVIAATDDASINGRVSEYCMAEHIPVNVVDDRGKCSFFFPALVREGSLTVGISTDGKSPLAASFLRKKISDNLPGGIGEIIDYMGQIRPYVMNLKVEESARKEILGKLFLQCLEKGRGIHMDKVRIGTRGSKLALKQAAMVQAALREAFGFLETEIVVIHTKGDKIQDKPLSEIGEKGVFASELERALQEGEIDLAVHSAKDLPMVLAEGMSIEAVLPRGDVRDVLVTPKGGRLPFPMGCQPEAAVPFGADKDGAEAAELFVIGSGSRRRQQQACRLWENVTCENIRGNIDTRLRKLIDGHDGKTAGEGMKYHGIILAGAGLDRLDITSGQDGRFDFYPLSPEEFLPAACQGIIAVETLRDSAVAALCRGITDAETALCFSVEREALLALSADCSEAAAAWCRRETERLTLDVMYAGKRARLTCAVQLDAGLKMARQAAELVKEKEQI